MDMEVRYGLAGRCSVIDPDVVPGGVKLGVKQRLCFVEQVQQTVTFLRRDLEKRADVPFRDDQGVA